MTVLMVAGIAVILAGLVAIGFGIPYKEFSVGNTLILTGTIGACTGLLMLGLSMVIRELKALGRRLGSVQATAAPRTLPPLELPPLDDEAPAEPRGKDEFLFARDQSAAQSLTPPDSARPPAPGTPPPWQDEAASRDRPRPRDDLPPLPPAPESEPKPRRNLLFSSTSRKERERDASRPGEPAAPVAAEAGPRTTFEDAWPQSDRARSDAPRRAERAPSTFADRAAAAPVTPPPREPYREEAPAVTVLKSGVVDGMAYSLYSDGSIEAQMPEGMMRFASIDELRQHLDARE